MKREKYLAFSFLVLCQFYIYGSPLLAQPLDTAKQVARVDSKMSTDLKSSGPHLGAIVSVNLGAYNGFHDGGQFGSILQPNLGIEFLAEPGGPLSYLIGARFGFLSSPTTGISLGLREPFNNPNPDIKLFGDLSILFFDDDQFNGGWKYGARLALGARTLGNTEIEYRLAGEWRGKGLDSVDGYRSRVLWWVGAEIGIGFSFSRESKPLTRKDSLHASLRYIATSDEIDELDALSSDANIDRWLDRFWRVRDLTPDTKLNEARLEFEKRVEIANRTFSHGKTLGVLTDPGRVMLIYGQPDIIDEDRSLSNDQDKYQLWIYNGRVRSFSFAMFLFANTSSTLDWRQIYSNVAGELSGVLPDGLPSRIRNTILNTQ